MNSIANLVILAVLALATAKATRTRQRIEETAEFIRTTVAVGRQDPREPLQ